MSTYCWRGVRTGLVYRFFPIALPAAFLDPNGRPLGELVWNDELVIEVNRDGSMARGTAGPAPPTDIYAPGLIPSLWEMAPQEQVFPPKGVPSSLPRGLPFSLGSIEDP